MKFLFPVLLASAFALATGAAPAGEYTLLVHESAAEFARRGDPSADGQAYWAEYAEYGRALQQAGVLRGGAALQVEPGATGAAAGRTLGGYFVIESGDDATARAWADRAPASRRGGRVEVRRMLPNPAMR